MTDTFMQIDTMGERTENQYLLALAIARRVRKIRSGAPAMVDDIENSRRRPFQAAMEEFARGRILFGLDEEKQ
jgi:DNA-directed RNA polymerase subunit K/omega